ncbi:MAG: hypothetical protein KME50_30180 [Nostoc desertorum CM1-VF14]|jgi:hypothetical protein|nr:hypothetical protein [Nostoc desertorum CM1-VF14]
MKSQETQNTAKKNNLPLAEDTPNYIDPQEPGKSEPMTQVQKDNVITSQDLPDPRFRYGFTLVIFGAVLFVIAIYYGIINP